MDFNTKNMTPEYELKRDAAYYRGWCQAFGENESLPGDASHIFHTSHFMYATGTRILSLSSEKPWSIIYKEIGAIHIKLG